MDDVTQTDIAIIGGGLAGAAMAASLADSEYSVTLLDARPWPDSPDLTDKHQPRVSAITPGTIKFLKTLGAWEQIPASRVSPYTRMHVREADGTGEINFSADDLRIDSLGCIVENHLIQAALLAKLNASVNVRTLAPTTVTACEPFRWQVITRQARHRRRRCALADAGPAKNPRARLGLPPPCHCDYGLYRATTSANCPTNIPR